MGGAEQPEGPLAEVEVHSRCSVPRIGQRIEAGDRIAQGVQDTQPPGHVAGPELIFRNDEARLHSSGEGSWCISGVVFELIEQRGRLVEADLPRANGPRDSRVRLGRVGSRADAVLGPEAQTVAPFAVRQGPAALYELQAVQGVFLARSRYRMLDTINETGRYR